MSALEEKIREWLAEHDACVDSDCHQEHIDAIRAVLDIPDWPDREAPAAVALAWNRALDTARQAIAHQLGIDILAAFGLTGVSDV